MPKNVPLICSLDIRNRVYSLLSLLMGGNDRSGQESVEKECSYPLTGGWITAGSKDCPGVVVILCPCVHPHKRTLHVDILPFCKYHT